MKEADKQLMRRLRAERTGYQDPSDDQFVPATNTSMRLMTDANADELMRKAAWHGLKAFERRMLGPEFIAAIKVRNQVARKALGPRSNFYEYKLKMAEGMSMDQVFPFSKLLKERRESRPG